jgi:anti-sigma factor RsiW
MLCAERLISEYVDGDLAPAVARQLEQHLMVCADCRVLLHDYRSLIAITQSLALTTPHARVDRPSPITEISSRRDILSQARISDLPA